MRRVLSNLALPLDQSGQPLITGEVSVLRHGAAYFVYFNDWGGCAGVDCCSSSGGCASCCMTQGGDACVYATNHSVVVYRTVNFLEWHYLGVALSLQRRASGIMFRPCVVYNAAQRRFVMWYEDRHPGQRGYAVAVSDQPTGPFTTVVNSTRMSGPGRKDNSGDFNILIDRDGAAFHVRDGFVVERLTDDYLHGSGVFGSFSPPRHSEGPVFFRRGGSYYILTGSACCACKGGASVDVFVASAPLGPYRYLGDIGSDRSRPYDPHSARNFVTRAQGSSVFEIGGEVVWLGNQWVTSSLPGRPRNHDLLYFAPLSFHTIGTLEQLSWQDNVSLSSTPKDTELS